MKRVLACVVLVSFGASAQQQPMQQQQQQQPQQPMEQQPMQQQQQPTRQSVTADMQKTWGFVPGFMKALPDAALPGIWEQMKTLQLSNTTAIPPRFKELIGLAVASQVPCAYCVVAHTEFARANGATDAELGTAIAEAGLTRQWSAFTAGTQVDEAQLRKDLMKMTANMKQSMSGVPKPMMQVTDADSAYKDIERQYGFVPEHYRRYPKAALPGAWRTIRDIEMNPNGAMPPKYVVLAGLAVASQVPCQYCVISGTELARTYGATDAEISEAVAIAGYTRLMSTMLNGMQLDMAAFKADIARLAKPRAKKQAMLGP